MIDCKLQILIKIITTHQIFVLVKSPAACQRCEHPKCWVRTKVQLEKILETSFYTPEGHLVGNIVIISLHFFSFSFSQMCALCSLFVIRGGVVCGGNIGSDQRGALLLLLIQIRTDTLLCTGMIGGFNAGKNLILQAPLCHRDKKESWRQQHHDPPSECRT